MVYTVLDFAFQMFLEEVLRRTGDLTPLVWNKPLGSHATSLSGLLPRGPAAYASRRCTRTMGSSSRSLSVVADGVELDVLTIPYMLGTYCAFWTANLQTTKHSMLSSWRSSKQMESTAACIVLSRLFSCLKSNGSGISSNATPKAVCAPSSSVACNEVHQRLPDT